MNTFFVVIKAQRKKKPAQVNEYENQLSHTGIYKVLAIS
jgi:hypothetical protein